MTPVKKETPKAMDIVREYWGDAAPAWVWQLASYCDATNQAKAASKISRSPSLVNMVLKNKYTGNLIDVQRRVEKALSEGPLVCPILGAITGAACLETQKKGYNPGNHLAVRLFVACKKCPNNVSCKGKKP